ncbi:MAG: carboxylate--amine ligase [Pseudomonadota bacterium]|nr:carboxylate--amine ligase [Pseudomonadota bacterium]
MNVVYLSPHFPPNYYNFCVALRRHNVNVLGIGEDHYHNLKPELKGALTEYYHLYNMEDHDQVLRAVAFFTHKYGKIDRVESLNEHWIELEAYLRENFNVFGKKIAETEQIKRKSLMKKKFMDAGVDVVPGAVVRTIDEAREFIHGVGYPVIAKPDKGVGAAATYKLQDEDMLERFFAQKPPIDYFMETFVTGEIVTFDGLADRDGNILFHTSLKYSRNIMEVVNEDDHVYYYTLRELPENLVRAGEASVRAFEVREKFFHFEFFRTPDDRIVGLELNLRPPGGLTTDMMNFANDFDVYREWANVVVHNRFEAHWSKRYHCMYIGRKNNIRYRHRHDEILHRYYHQLVLVTEMPPIFRNAMGDFAYIARSPSLEELLEMAQFVHARAEY